MRKLMNTLMLSCMKASELIDKQSAIKLSIKERAMLHLHTTMCDGCKVYQRQSKLLDDILYNHIRSSEDNVPQIKNNELKQHIISKL